VSLPGLGLERVQRVFLQYGGTPGQEGAPAAPDQATASPAPQPQAPAQSTGGSSMAGSLDAIIGIASAINPEVGLIAGLAKSLIGAFAPAVQQNIENKLEKHSDPNVQQQAYQHVVDAALVAANMVKGQEIAATVTVQKDPALIQKVQDDSVSRIDAYLKSIAPLIDKISEQDKMVNDAIIAGRKSAMDAQEKDHHGIVKLVAQSITRTKAGVLIGIGVAVVVAMVCKAVWPQTPDYVLPLLTLLGPLVGSAFKESGAVVAYYFDGTPTSNATNALNSAIATVKPPTAP
jgi:hypothetical protein